MNDRFKFRVWDKKHNEYISSNMIGSLLYFGHRDEFHIEFECFSTFANSLIIEQCTGLKDKNGNLIYEGDFLTDGRDTGHVLWRGSGWGCTAFLWKKKPETLEICGNIHEQAEQKDVK